ncbi:MAG: hypothetical protein ACYDEN_02525 [Acidimicrobiales bacterium]
MPGTGLLPFDRSKHSKLAVPATRSETGVGPLVVGGTSHEVLRPPTTAAPLAG